MLHELLAVLLYSSRRDTPATRSPFLLCNAALRGASTIGGPRGWCAPGKHSAPPPPLTPGLKERRQIQLYIASNLRNVFASFLEHFAEKERLFNERALALQGKFPVLKTRKGKVDPKCRAERAKPGSPFSKPGNPTGVNQYTRAVDPVTERKPPKPPGRFGPIPYIKAKKEKEATDVRFPRRAD
jgi:hypothetical protein